MIERIVENWLTNTNEKNYQVPFCQCLLSQGYTVLHLSSHGQMEQGKDIITIDKSGVPCAFQLKGGDIDGNTFRQIKGEIDELVEIRINFPGVTKDIQHRAVLVTNGTITDKVRRDIDDLNLTYRQRGFSCLEVKTKLDLLKDFIEVNGSFLPTRLDDFKLFLELLLYNGRKPANKLMLAHFFETILLSGKDTKLELKRKIASALLLTEYVINPFEKLQNHISIIEGWTLFGSYILAVAEKYSLEPEYWEQSYNLVIHKINLQLNSLKTEFFSRKNYYESSWDGGEINKTRLVIVLGWLSSFELFLKQNDPSYVMDKQVHNYITKFYGEKSLWFWGESATSFFISMSLFVRKNGDSALSNRLINDLIALIASENTAEDRKHFLQPFADPYYGPEEILGSFYGLKKIDFNSFRGASYHIGALVDIMVRLNERSLLNNYWKDISVIRKCEFQPTPPWKMLTWQSEEGDQIEVFYERPQSWSKLLRDATDFNSVVLPKTLVNNPFSYYFLMCYPHRLGQKTIKLIDKGN